MFQYECEKGPSSSQSSIRASTSGWGRPPSSGSCPARRPLPPRPIVCERIPNKATVPLKVWVIASASCFAVCAALVLATVVITRWGTAQYTRQILDEPDPFYPNPHPIYNPPKIITTTEPTTTTKDVTQDEMEIFEKISFFKNVVAKREPIKNVDLISKHQIHPLHDTSIVHKDRKIQKKDQAKLPHDEIKQDIVPDFKPTLPDVFIDGEVKLPDGYLLGLGRDISEYDEYYTDTNLYDDYVQSNTMTGYLLEKIQELHDWIHSDPDFESVKNSTSVGNNSSQFTDVLQALNQSIIQGNVTIVMNKLKDLYYVDNYTAGHGKRMIVSNSTDLLSFGILSLDIMLLHNIQLMAWENQEAARIKMLKDPDVFAFNALFMDPSKVEAKQNEINHQQAFSKRQSLRKEVDEFDIGKSMLESVLDVGMSAARAAINLGRAYKNTKTILAQVSNKSHIPPQNQLSRNIDGNSYALNRLQTSYEMSNGSYYTELDCMWLLYCKNLVATSKLSAPYGVMARINGMALRMITGELSSDRALETMLYEALSGWTELNCDQMFPRCSAVDAASVVMETIRQPLRKS